MHPTSVYVAVAMLNAWPSRLDFVDFGTKFTLCIAVAVNRWNLEILSVGSIMKTGKYAQRFHGQTPQLGQETKATTLVSNIQALIMTRTHPLMVLIRFKVLEGNDHLDRINSDLCLC